MKTYVFDIEADGLLLQATKIHVACFYCVEDDKVSTFRVNEFGDAALYDYIYAIPDGSTIIGHNVIGYDLPLLRRLHGIGYKIGREDEWIEGKVNFVDTFHLSQFLLPDRIGGHSLDNLAQLAGTYKQDYKGGWDKWSQEMQDYCIQDVKATVKVYNYLMRELKEKHE